MTRTKTSNKRRCIRPRMSVKLNKTTFQDLVEQTVQDLYGKTMWGGTRYCFSSPGLMKFKKPPKRFLGRCYQVENISIDSGRQNILPRDVRVWKQIVDFKVKHDNSRMSLCELFNSVPLKKKYKR